jgi:hypothetical protein
MSVARGVGTGRWGHGELLSSEWQWQKRGLWHRDCHASTFYSKAYLTGANADIRY